jgi:hypothetical protein
MQHMDCISHAHRLDRAKGVAPVIIHQLVDAGTKTLPRLRRIGRSPQLDHEERNTHVLLDRHWEFLEILLRAALSTETFRSCAIPSDGVYAGIIRHMRQTRDGGLILHQSSTNRIILMTPVRDVPTR